MLKKFCDTCEEEMPLDSGFEISYREPARKEHVCSWICIQQPARGASVESIKNLTPKKPWVTDGSGKKHPVFGRAVKDFEFVTLNPDGIVEKH